MRNINSGEIFQINLSKRESSCHPKVLCDLFDTKEPKDVALRCQKAQSAATTSLTHLIALSSHYLCLLLVCLLVLNKCGRKEAKKET